MAYALTASAAGLYGTGAGQGVAIRRNDDPQSSGRSDIELVARLRRRDELALGMMYDIYHRLVYAIALRITGAHEAAEEVTQDVFQTVWVSIDSFRLDASLPAWLVGITRHRAIDHTRTRRFRARNYEQQLDDRRCSEPGDGSAEALVLREAIRAALDGLPAPQRQALYLAFYGGMTHAEIADQIGQPVGTVKSRIRLGLLRLRESLEA